MATAKRATRALAIPMTWLLLALPAAAASAQDMSVPTVTTADPGQLFPNDEIVRSTDPYLNPGKRSRQGDTRRGTSSSRESSTVRGGVSRTAPRPDPARLESVAATLKPEYDRRVRQDGKASADRWLSAVAREIGRRDGEAARAARTR